MCGIAGFIDPSLNKDAAQAYISKMLQSISHRGPDNTSIWNELPVVLGHNRLTIIDLSDAANQPMIYRDACIIYNGEIYNYIEIREELEMKGYVFTTSSDTEVILASYYEWGTKCVERFVGMWAFAMWDSKEKLLFCSRDRFGIKPFHYIFSDTKFYFASEYRALKVSPLFSNELNLNQVKRGLQLGWICYDDETYFERIKSIPAAHNLIYKDGKISLERYWDIDTGKSLDISFKEKKEMFYELFFKSIRLHMRSDVPVASCLSGGLDSSSIVSCIKNIFPDTAYKTFSVFYSGKNQVDERPFIYEVLKKYKGIEPYYFSPANQEVEEYFHKISDCVEVPLSGSSYISQYFLMKLIGDHKIKVVLDGQGSDEYLAGYMHTFYRLVADYIKKINLSKAVTTTFAVNKKLNANFSKTMLHFGKSMLCVMKDEQDLYSLEYKNYFPFLFTGTNSEIPFSLPGKNGNAVTNFLYHLLFTTSLPSLLHYEDRTSMAYSIESRVPFLDHRLVEFCFKLKNEDKIAGTETKYILREALSGILPDAIKNRKDKKGFVTPGEIEWLRGPLKFLLEGSFTNLDFLDQKKVKGLLKEFRNGENKYASLVWRLATLNSWIGKN